MNETISILKLASKFLNPKDVRSFMNYVQVLKDDELDTIKFMASNGHIAIKVTRKGTAFSDHLALPNQVSNESILKAAKVNEFSLLNEGEPGVRFPDYDKCFNRTDKYNLERVGFDTRYLALIFTALEQFRKEMKLALTVIAIDALSISSANLMSLIIDPDSPNEIKIDIAIMPCKL